MNVTGRRRSRAVAVLLAGIFAAGVAGAADLGRLLPGLDQESVVQRFERRAARPAPNLLVVAVDDKTFADTGYDWPFKRRYHAQAIDRLRRDGARVIVYDVQFTEQTTARDDNALITAVDKANNVVLATAETNEKGGSNVLGGDKFLHSIGAEAAASNLPEGRGGVLQRVEYAHGGLPTLATVVARRTGHPTKPSSFEKDGAWIDFHGPPGTIDTVSFSDLINGHVDPARVRGRIVVVGAASPTLQDVHPTPTSDTPMSGPEIEANAIDTVMRGMPLHGTPRWAGLLIVLALGFLPALVSLRLRPLVAVAVVPAIAFVFLFIAQRAFDHGRILPVAMPLFALALGMVTTHRRGLRDRAPPALPRDAAQRRARRGRARAHGRAARDAARGHPPPGAGHRVARPGDGPAPRAHQPDVRAPRVGVGDDPDRGRDAAQREPAARRGQDRRPRRDPAAARRALAARTASSCAATRPSAPSCCPGSSSDVMRMAEEIARTHHERWDGQGYPAGLAGEAIPLVGRICAVCDVFDALLSDRPYKEPWPVPEALDVLRNESAKHFDPAVVDAFLRIVDDLEPTLLAASARSAPAPADRPAPRATAPRSG